MDFLPPLMSAFAQNAFQKEAGLLKNAGSQGVSISQRSIFLPFLVSSFLDRYIPHLCSLTLWPA